ncbi:alpha/beta hydrolase [Rhodococcus oryzae]|uniref:alpha/beta hydrolase n=1 Tax=Rhodococcus oryzae TaxID=2571143 RepID=UPI0037244ABC
MRTNRRLSGRIILVLSTIATAIAAAACSTADSTSTTMHSSDSGAAISMPPAAPIDWQPCPEDLDPTAHKVPPDRIAVLDFSCGTQQMPVDYSEPNGDKLSVFLLRVHARDQPSRTGSLLVNNGGPGGLGTNAAFEWAAKTSDDVLRHFDIIGFDPRGVGRSSPVACLSDSRKDELFGVLRDLETIDGVTEARRLNSAINDECRNAAGPNLVHLNSTETAMDMDQIRESLGEASMNFYGPSYGTVLAGAYAHLFPTKVRTVVVDGAVDYAIGPIAAEEGQAAGTEQAFDQFAQWCIADPTCQAIGDPRIAVQALIETTTQTPLKAAGADSPRPVTSADIAYTAAKLLYFQDYWPRLGAAFAQAIVHGDGTDFRTYTDLLGKRAPDGRRDENFTDAVRTVNCNDMSAQQFPDDAAVRRLATDWVSKYPIFGLYQANGLDNQLLLGCTGWPSAPHPITAESSDATGSAPILVIGGRHDPSTPYQWAVDFAKTLKTGVLLTSEGQGHTQYFSNSCVADLTDRYLIEGTAPADGSICAKDRDNSSTR